jgi:hypothetical protein
MSGKLEELDSNDSVELRVEKTNSLECETKNQLDYSKHFQTADFSGTINELEPLKNTNNRNYNTFDSINQISFEESTFSNNNMIYHNESSNFYELTNPNVLGYSNGFQNRKSFIKLLKMVRIAHKETSYALLSRDLFFSYYLAL